MINSAIARSFWRPSRSKLLTILYHENPAFPDQSCVVVPEPLRHALLKESHCGRFAGHLSEKKVYDRLRRHVWRKGSAQVLQSLSGMCIMEGWSQDMLSASTTHQV